MVINVTTNDNKGIISGEMLNALLKYSAEYEEKFIPPQTPSTNATKEAISITNPLRNPL